VAPPGGWLFPAPGNHHVILSRRPQSGLAVHATAFELSGCVAYYSKSVSFQFYEVRSTMNLKCGIVCVTAVFLGSGFSGFAQADIFAFTDDDGTINLSNVPADTRYALMLAAPGQPASTVPASGNLLLDATKQQRYSPLIAEVAQAYQVETALLHAVITAESGYNPGALSKKGAAGLMQLMPDTARRYGVTNPLDPLQNVHGGAQYLRDLLAMFNQDLHLALAAYNAGENAVLRYGNRVPPYRETLSYVPKVLELYRKYRATM
jgi:soluble lytic murein transglycosylase-like protein